MILTYVSQTRSKIAIFGHETWPLKKVPEVPVQYSVLQTYHYVILQHAASNKTWLTKSTQ